VHAWKGEEGHAQKTRQLHRDGVPRVGVGSRASRSAIRTVQDNAEPARLSNAAVITVKVKPSPTGTILL
jgi:hypothetical protein